MAKLSKSEAGKLGQLKSRKIHEEHYQERIKNYYLNPDKCLFCGTVIDYKRRGCKFCNHSCSASYNNKFKIKLPDAFCLHCNKKLNNKYKKYCNNKCQKSYEWYLRKQEIEQTQVYGKNDCESRYYAKKYLIEKYGNKCQICGCSEWLGKPILLIADHIDGDANNNNIENLRIICSNCDATLDTYKNKNKSTRKR